MLDADGIKSLIVRAFANSVRPEPAATVADSSLEASMIRTYLVRYRWDEVSTSILNEYDTRADLSAIIAFLSVDGLRYYMPSFLLYLIEEGSKAGLILDSLLDCLIGERVGIGPRDFASPQRQAICMSLQHLAEIHRKDPVTSEEIADAIRIWCIR